MNRDDVVAPLRRSLFEVGRFLIGEEGLVGQIARTLEWCRSAVIPEPLQIGMPVGCARHRGLNSSALGLRSRSGDQSGIDSKNDEQRRDQWPHGHKPNAVSA